MKKAFLFIFFSAVGLCASAQETFDFVGYLNTENSNIPFEIHITFGQDTVTGYSVTWKGLLYETVTKLDLEVDTTGEYSTVKLLETSNIRTRYSETNTEFCFVTGSYRVRNEDGKSLIDGVFTAKNASGRPCPGGTVRLWSDKLFPPRRATASQNASSQEELTDTTSTPPTETPEPTPETQPDTSPITSRTKASKLASTKVSLDTVRQGYLTADNVYQYKTSSRTLRLQFSDFSNPDGDSLTVYVNNRKVYDNVRLTPLQNDLSIPLSSTGVDTVKIKILNEGEISPNTSQFNFFDDGEMRFYNFLVNGKKDDEIILLILKK